MAWGALDGQTQAHPQAGDTVQVGLGREGCHGLLAGVVALHESARTNNGGRMTNLRAIPITKWACVSRLLPVARSFASLGAR